MNQDLIEAKIAIAKAKKESSNQERVLAEIITLSRVKRGLYTGEMIDVIPAKLNMSESLYRKTIHDLRKAGLIQKVGLCTYVNPLYIKLISDNTKVEFYIGVDTRDPNNCAYCLTRKVDGITDIVFPKVMNNVIELEQEVHNLAKYFKAAIIRDK